jgi:hypothetical protein
MSKGGTLSSNKQREKQRPSTTEQKRPIGTNRKDRNPFLSVGGSVSKVSVVPNSISASQLQKSSLVLKANDTKTKPVTSKASAFTPKINKKSVGKKLIHEKRRPSSAAEYSTPISESTPTIRTRASSMIDRTRGKIKLAFNMNEKSTSSIARYWKKQAKDLNKDHNLQESLSSSNSNFANQNHHTTLVQDAGNIVDHVSVRE